MWWIAGWIFLFINLAVGLSGGETREPFMLALACFAVASIIDAIKESK